MRRAAALILIAFFLSIPFVHPVFGGQYEEAVDAYEREDYKTAYRLFKPLAEQGDTQAQNTIGAMYDKGRGVPKDYAEAAKWYRKAAEQGDLIGQNNLGEMYEKGKGVPKDYVLAYMWFNLATTTDSKGLREWALKNRNRVAAQMTPEQIAEAQRLSGEWKPKEEGKSGERSN